MRVNHIFAILVQAILWSVGPIVAASSAERPPPIPINLGGQMTSTLSARSGTQNVTISYVQGADPFLLNLDIENGSLFDSSSYGVPVDGDGLVFTEGRNGGEAVHLDSKAGFELDESEIGQVFGLDEFTLTFGFRADAPGEIMRIHTAFDVDVAQDGQVEIALTNATGDTFTLSSQGSVLDGEWHDVTVTFDGTGGEFGLYLDGVEVASTEAWGTTQPMEKWGLSVGGAWNHGFTGELDNLELHAEAVAPTTTAEPVASTDPDAGLEPPASEPDTTTDPDTGSDQPTTSEPGAITDPVAGSDEPVASDPDTTVDEIGSDPIPTGPVIDVADAAGLMAALQGASGGETIRLAPGDYGSLILDPNRQPWAEFNPPVTIASADADHPASFAKMSLSGVSGLTFENLLFDYKAAPGAPIYINPFSVTSCNNITIRDSVFDGDLATGVDAIADGHGTGKGLMVGGGSSNVVIEGNEFFHWFVGAAFGGNTDLKVVGNEVHSIRSDGFDFVKNQGVLIEQNYFHDFDRAEGSPDHSDMIQFWTTDADDLTTDVVIRENRFMSGEGDLTQSIFMRNGMVDTGRAGYELYYKNILIENNLIWNSHTHGITVGATDGLIIRNNTVLHNAASGDIAPKINLNSSSLNVTVTNNIASNTPGGQAGWDIDNNLIVQRDSPSLPNYYGDLFVNALNDGLAGYEDLQALPGGIIELGGYGAEITRYDPTPDALTALVRLGCVQGDKSMATFDASLTAAPEGLVDGSEARFLWDFGDGTAGEGIATSHDYAAPGVYVASLKVVAADGTQDITQFRVDVRDPVLLDVDVKNDDVFDASSYAAPLQEFDLLFTEGRIGEAVHIDRDSGFGFDRTAVKQIFDLDQFDLSFGIRADTPGEILRIHNAFLVTIDSQGRISVELTNSDGKTFTLLSPRSVTDGEWHDVTLDFDGIGGFFSLSMDGVQMDGTEAWGRTQPMESWGLTVGGGGWREGFTGELDDLELRSDAGQSGGDGNFAITSLASSMLDDSLVVDGELALASLAAPEPVSLDTSLSSTIQAGTEPVEGTTGDDRLNGRKGDDVLLGGDGCDRLNGRGGDDWLDVGGNGADSGAQHAYGRHGDDTYVFSRETGELFVTSRAEGVSSGVADRVLFTDLMLTDLTIGIHDDESRHGQTLELTWDDGESSSTLHISNEGQFVEYYEFADGTIVTAHDLLALV